MYTVVENVGVVSTWSVRISKYGRCGYAKLKIAINRGKKRGWLVIMFGCISK
jgi:hypothetical protein